MILQPLQCNLAYRFIDANFAEWYHYVCLFQYCEDDEQSLSARHQTLLAEMCIDQLNSELSDAASRQIETNNEMERKLKEIESLKSKLKYANAKRIVAAQVCIAHRDNPSFSQVLLNLVHWSVQST